MGGSLKGKGLRVLRFGVRVCRLRVLVNLPSLVRV